MSRLINTTPAGRGSMSCSILSDGSRRRPLLRADEGADSECFRRRCLPQVASNHGCTYLLQAPEQAEVSCPCQLPVVRQGPPVNLQPETFSG